MNDNKNTECIICLESSNTLHKIKCCNSYYHKECLLQALATMQYFQCPHCKKQLEREEEPSPFCDYMMYHCFSVFFMMFDFALSFSGSNVIVRFTTHYPDDRDTEPAHYYPIMLLTIIVSMINIALLLMYSKYYFYIWKYKPLYGEEPERFNYICNHYILHITRLISYTPVVIFSSIIDKKAINIYYSIIGFLITIPYILIMLIITTCYNSSNNPTALINPRSKFYKLLSIKFENVDQSTIDVDRYIV